MKLTLAVIATLNDRYRLHPLTIAMRSLLPQVDVLAVCLNGYDSMPVWCKEIDPTIRLTEDGAKSALGQKLWVVWSGENRGSSEKLAPLYLWGDDKSQFSWDGYYFCCDDDLEYPPDYVARMVAELERYNGEVIVTAGGRTMKPDAKRWRDWIGDGAYISAVPVSRWINYCGGFAFAFDASKIQPPYPLDDKNEEEAHLSVWAQREGIPIRLVARPEDWPKRIPMPARAWTSFAAAAREGFATRSRIISQVEEWVVHEPCGAAIDNPAESS